MKIGGLILAVAVLTLSGCTVVKPWQKKELGKPHMAFDVVPLESKFMQHVYQSKEGSFGGYGVDSGGCGCN